MKELSPRSQKALYVVIFVVIVACLATAVYLIQRDRVHPTSTSASAATQCDVTTYPNGNDGLAVYVNASGPDRVSVDLISDIGRHNHAEMQVTQRAGGAMFAFPQVGTPRSLEVSSRKLGSCAVPAVQIVPLSMGRAAQVAAFNRRSSR
jgi:hypothetical protein